MTDAPECPYAKGGACVRQAEHGDPCEVFECAGCHVTKPACAGGDADEQDATGELCTDCWFERRRTREESAA